MTHYEVRKRSALRKYERGTHGFVFSHLFVLRRSCAVLGFTMLEMLLVMGLFLFIGAFSLLSLKSGNNVQDARKEALRLVSTAREMERRTLSGSLAPEVNVASPRGGYGIRISADGTSYDAVVAPNEDDFTVLKTLRTAALPKSMTIAPSNFTVLFTQPKGVLCAQDASGTRFCGLCRVFTPGTSTCLSPIPLATAAQQKQTLTFSMDQPSLARVVIDLVGARFSAQ